MSDQPSEPTQADSQAQAGAERNGVPQMPEDPIAVLMRELMHTRTELEEVNMRLASIQVQLVLCGLLIVLATTVAVKLAKARTE